MSVLFEHQMAGADALRRIARAQGRRALLRDKPGLGKTRTLIAAARDVTSRNDRIVVVCPAIARAHWLREIEIMGLRDAYEWLVYSYASPKLPKSTDTLILDEIHYLKSSVAQRTKRLLGKDSLGRTASHVFGASGTLMWKNPDDLWTILSSLFPKVLLDYAIRNREQWRERFCVGFEGEWGYKVVGMRNIPQLREILDTIGIERTEADIGEDVPSLHWTTTVVDGDAPAVRRACEAVGITSPEQLAVESIESGSVRHVVGVAKAHAAAELIIEAIVNDPEEKLVVFAYHHDVLDILQQAFRTHGIESVRVDGRTAPAARGAHVDLFQSDERVRVFLGQIDACSTAITLTAAHRAFIVEPSWSATVNYQAGKRIARLGSAVDRCQVTMVALAGTIDEAVIGQHWREVGFQASLDAAGA